MPTRTKPWPAGVPCWVDMTTPDLDGVAAFYTAILGWEMPTTGASDTRFHIALVAGREVAAIAPEPTDAVSGWTMYFATDDADATAAAITAAGGGLVIEPGEVGIAGRMAMATDPTGARFGVWQAREQIGARLYGEPGAFAWDDLRTPDPARAREFYGDVFGHRYTEIGGGGDYQTFSPAGDGLPAGGVGPLMGEDDPLWLVSFATADAAGACTRAEELGGSVVTPPIDIPWGRTATLADPSGALFGLFEPPAGSAVPGRPE